MLYLGWILFGLTLMLYVGSQKLNQTKRMNLRAYVIFLLMNEEVRIAHQKDFKNWIRSIKSTSAMDLSSQAQNVIENMADNLAGTSILGSHALLWNSEENKRTIET